jgi:hypothetical protein
MSIFSYIFGSQGSEYSAVPHPLSEVEIRRIISEESLPILNQDKVRIVENAVIKARRDSKISLRTIYRTLVPLKNHGAEHERITIEDRHKIMNLFSSYFTEHFSG